MIWSLLTKTTGLEESLSPFYEPNLCQVFTHVCLSFCLFLYLLMQIRSAPSLAWEWGTCRQGKNPTVLWGLFFLHFRQFIRIQCMGLNVKVTYDLVFRHMSLYVCILSDCFLFDTSQTELHRIVWPRQRYELFGLPFWFQYLQSK